MLKPPASVNIAPLYFNLNPLGQGVVTHTLHEGRMFNVYRAIIGAEDVVLKTLSPELTGENVFSRKPAFEEGASETFVRTDRGLEKSAKSAAQKIDIAARLLQLEANTIRETNGAWNHRVIAAGSWDGFSKSTASPPPDSNRTKIEFNESPDLADVPVLVMPYHDARPFSMFSNARKRGLFPRMLPALWTALCKTTHGDLSESNILINNSGDIFHLIDPGVYINNSEEHINGQAALFTTNEQNYPFFSPVPDHPENSLSLFVQNHLHRLDSVNSPQPATGDLLAMGIIYYRILTGKEIFRDENVSRGLPFWEHSFMLPFDPVNKWAAEVLTGDSIKQEIENAGIPPAEKQLVQALLTFEITDLKELVKLCLRLK